MQLSFKKQSTYDTTPGTITFNTSTHTIGVANNNNSITEFNGGPVYANKINWGGIIILLEH